MNEIENMKKWFNSFKDEEKLILTIVCRWYPYHFDGYINSIYIKKFIQ